MKIVVFDSALPVTFGTPRQRASATLRRDLSRMADVRCVTVDCWGSEWNARRKCGQGDVFFPHALSASLTDTQAVLAWPQRLASMHRPVPLNAAPEAHPDAVQRSGWMNPDRISRLNVALRREMRGTAPDVVIVTDPMLWELAAQAVGDNIKLLCLDDRLDDWSSSLRSRYPIMTQWADVVQSDVAYNRATVTKTHRVAVPPLFPIEQEKSDLFMEKSAKITVLATGLPLLDEDILAQIRRFALSGPRADAYQENMVLMGFDPHNHAKFPRTEFHRNSVRLHTTLGVSRCLVVAQATPWLLPVIAAALSVGTPVLMTPGEAERAGLETRTGIFTCPVSRFSPALAEFAYSPIVTPELCRAIAHEAAELDPVDATSAMAGYLAELTGKKPVIAKTAAPPPPQRRSPLATPLEGLYEPVKQLLLVRADIWGWSHLEELRVSSESGVELTRFAPNRSQQAQGRYLLEGGLITPLEDLGSYLRIEGYCDSEQLFTQDIPCAGFERILGGIVTVDLEDGGASGTFWINADNVHDKWFVKAGEELTSVSPAQGRAVPSLGVHLVPFRTPSHMGPARRQHITLLHQPVGRGAAVVPAQTVFRGTAPDPRNLPARPDLVALKDIHKGRRAWIIGNGPSVRHEDLARIPQGDIVFGFNRFYLSYGDTPLREDYVVSADTLMIEDFGQEMIDVAHGLPLFCMPPAAVMSLEGDFVHVTPGASSVPDFSFDPLRYVTVGGSSVFVALQMAWHMGLRDISLYGMDYFFSATLGRDPRYPFPVAFNDDNHFIKGYREAKPWCPPTWRDISTGFLNARLAFEMTGGKVRNASRGGKLELFDRVDFDSRLREGQDA